ncbi:MAG TPA: alpha-amylase family glycosyl hydrolase [Candidatus Dormibacteraeota bacterium]|nr:alpha-amylase family glycosyl hydrolase [Candidatus Dormibacteraeota bacterium]
MTEAPVNQWWRDAVVYQIYPRSFQDTDGDGVGDLAGVTNSLEYLSWLGVDAVWLTPITASPDDDFGYDVSDYYSVQPVLGDLASVDRLLEAAGQCGIRVILDIVPNHTSDRHPWFKDARASREAAHRDWYVWAGPSRDGSLPNNWLSVFGGPAWEHDSATGEFYLHQFLPSQPDLNWWNPQVRDEFDRILRFWFDRGVAGFRVDTANKVVKDSLLRDNPPVGPADHALARRLGQRPAWTSSQPEVHEIWRRWRAVCREYEPERMLVGETWLFDLDEVARYYGADDELHLNFNIPFVDADFSAEALRKVVDQTEAALGRSRWPVWTASNHDVSRFPSRWCGGDPRLIRMGLTVLLTLRGTPFLYYGDELGMTDVAVPDDRTADPLSRRMPGQHRGRDPERTPMLWRHGPGAGFTDPDVEPWLPLGNSDISVEQQRDDRASTLRLCRDLIGLRRESHDLRAGGYVSLDAPDGVWIYRRGIGTVVALNFRDEEVRVRGVRGRVLIASDRGHDGSDVTGVLKLGPAEAVIVISDRR